MNRKMIKFIILALAIMQITALSACGKNEAGVPYGEYKNEECGTIVFDKDGITFKDMDPDFINEKRAGEQAGEDYFESRDEGIILSGEELSALKDKYLAEMADDNYVDCTLSYECTELEDYTVYFAVYDGDDYITSFYYDTTKKSIDYNRHEFKAD